jgi:hypothetical protein
VSALIFTEIVHAGDVRVADLACRLRTFHLTVPKMNAVLLVLSIFSQWEKSKYKKGPDPLCLQSRAALENAFCGDKIPADVY